MKAIRLRSPGIDGLSVDDVPAPVPAGDDVLVRVYAAALTRDELDWPVDRLPAIPSYELSGAVEATGEEVFALTDFGHDGVAAEYAAVPSALLVPKPASLDHVEAAALPLPALSAWQGLFDHGGLEAGQRVMITGRGGGVGHLAVQLAEWRGAEIVDDDAQLIFDTAGGDALRAGVRTGARVVSVAEEAEGATYFVVAPNTAQLAEIARLADEGRLRPLIDSVFPLRDARAAFERLGERGKKGKVVLRVSD